jgi:hypothetical protein
VVLEYLSHCARHTLHYREGNTHASAILFDIGRKRTMRTWKCETTSKRWECNAVENLYNGNRVRKRTLALSTVRHGEEKKKEAGNDRNCKREPK